MLYAVTIAGVGVVKCPGAIALPCRAHQVRDCLLPDQAQGRESNQVPARAKISVIWILTYFAVSTTWLSFLLVQRFGNELFDWYETSGKINVGVMIAVQVGILYPPLFYLLNQMLFDMAQLPEQLQSFDIEIAECFCCSDNHRQPVSGEQIPM